ncbi:hypothetical protein D3C72_2590860 [compost metagenome]
MTEATDAPLAFSVAMACTCRFSVPLKSLGGVRLSCAKFQPVMVAIDSASVAT